ncbi:arylesterase [Marinobacterium weihaiense]|uniref:Arylesterase n=1 Tax=Marinobacterium weihaiense TaxID=2851016 RepID=A0ABS6MDZ0_9GAMM|nr:arylesterase [Marinobacterium weihaiense]MBV0933962.1 arylesterase [Marinobacterium weihaiense]
MRSLISMVFILLVWATPLQAKTLLVLGDSLSAAYGLPAEQGWVSLLEQELRQRQLAQRVINASISGETSSGGLQRLPRLLNDYRPDLVVLELGANDGLRGTPLRIMERNLRQMVELSRQAGAQVMLIGIRIPPNYGPQYTQRFYSIYPELAQEYDLALVPFLLERVALKPQFMQADGLHPTAAAQPILLQTVWPHLYPLLQPAES